MDGIQMLSLVIAFRVEDLLFYICGQNVVNVCAFRLLDLDSFCGFSTFVPSSSTLPSAFLFLSQSFFNETEKLMEALKYTLYGSI